MSGVVGTSSEKVPPVSAEWPGNGVGLKGADRSGKEAEESTGTSEASEERNEAPDWSGRGLSSLLPHVWRCIHRLRCPLVSPSPLSLVRPKTALTSLTLLTESRPTVSESPPALDFRDLLTAPPFACEGSRWSPSHSLCALPSVACLRRPGAPRAGPLSVPPTHPPTGATRLPSRFAPHGSRRSPFVRASRCSALALIPRTIPSRGPCSRVTSFPARSSGPLFGRSRSGHARQRAPPHQPTHTSHNPAIFAVVFEGKG